MANSICNSYDDVVKWKYLSRYRWIPLTKARDVKLWCFLWSAPKQTAEQIIETPAIWDAIAPIMTSLWWVESFTSSPWVLPIVLQSCLLVGASSLSDPMNARATSRLKCLDPRIIWSKKTCDTGNEYKMWRHLNSADIQVKSGPVCGLLFHNFIISFLLPISTHAPFINMVIAWICQRIQRFLWDLITHPCHSFNGSSAKPPLK